jgi:uncharacterized protein YggT (Ycf19 family)
MSIDGVDGTNSVQLDEERRQASHQEVKASIDNDVNAGIRQSSARAEPADSAEIASVAHQLKHKSVNQAAQTERELGRGRVAARISQVVDYIFFLIYGLIALEFLLKLLGAAHSNGFVQFINSLTWPLLSPFAGIVPSPTSGRYQIDVSYLLALGVYLLIHVAINGAFRLVAYRKVSV